MYSRNVYFLKFSYAKETVIVTFNARNNILYIIDNYSFCWILLCLMNNYFTTEPILVHLPQRLHVCFQVSRRLHIVNQIVPAFHAQEDFNSLIPRLKRKTSSFLKIYKSQRKLSTEHTVIRIWKVEAALSARVNKCDKTCFTVERICSLTFEQPVPWKQTNSQS